MHTRPGAYTSLRASCPLTAVCIRIIRSSLCLCLFSCCPKRVPKKCGRCKGPIPKRTFTASGNNSSYIRSLVRSTAAVSELLNLQLSTSTTRHTCVLHFSSLWSCRRSTSARAGKPFMNDAGLRMLWRAQSRVNVSVCLRTKCAAAEKGKKLIFDSILSTLLFSAPSLHLACVLCKPLDFFRSDEAASGWLIYIRAARPPTD